MYYNLAAKVIKKRQSIKRKHKIFIKKAQYTMMMVSPLHPTLNKNGASVMEAPHNVYR